MFTPYCVPARSTRAANLIKQFTSYYSNLTVISPFNCETTKLSSPMESVTDKGFNKPVKLTNSNYLSWSQKLENYLSHQHYCL